MEGRYREETFKENDVSEVPNLHWARLGTTAQILPFWEVGYAQQLDVYKLGCRTIWVLNYSQ